MSDYDLTPDVIELIAERFRALGEPARLRLLDALRDGEMTVSELVERTGLGQANVSKHLHILLTLGFVARQKEGVFVRYRLAGEDVFRLCDVMCERVALEAGLRSRALGG